MIEKEFIPVKDLFISQPDFCREKFKTDGREIKIKWVQRILEYDPSDIFERFRYNKVDCFTRYNYPLFEEMFPNKEAMCACGCNREPKKNNKWFNNECQRVAAGVYQILSGISPYIAFILRIYKGDNLCVRCNEEDGTDMDHKVPIKNGGGFSYLNNFQMLGRNCHVIKTREDFGWKPLSRKTNKYVRKADRDESKIKRRGSRKKTDNK